MIFSKTPQRPCITKSGRWVYTASADVPTGTTVRIAVTASDRPGGVGSAEEEKAP